jgi:hypothetical protein
LRPATDRVLSVEGYAITTFSQTLTFVIGLLYLEKRVSYRRLRKEFGLDDETLDDVRHELIGKRLEVVIESMRGQHKRLVTAPAAQQPTGNTCDPLCVGRCRSGAEFVRRLPATALAAGRTSSERVQASSQWTRRWGEMDSNHRYRIRNILFWLPPFGPAIRLPQQKPALSCRGPVVRILLMKLTVQV